MKIAIVNDHVGPLSGEKENFWTHLVKELSAVPISFAELKEPLEDVIERENPDVIIANSIWGMRFPGRFVITLLQDNYVAMQEKLGMDFSENIRRQKAALKASNIRVANSNFTANSYKDCGDFNVIPLGTDSELFRPMNHREDLRKKYGIPLDSKVYISVLSHHPVKGWDRIKQDIDSFKGSFWILVFKDHPETDTRITKSFCRIPQENLAELYNCADIFISESMVETQGLALIEACFCGVPVMATRTGITWDWYPESSNPRASAFKHGLDKQSCMTSWKNLVGGIKL